MKDSQFIDEIQRKINSILFRVVLILYAIMILSLKENFLPTYVYIIAFIAFTSLYIKYIRKQMIRLLNDFLFLAIIIFGKNPNDVIVFVFLLLPNINAINFSGDKKSIMMYVLNIAVFFIALSYYLRGKELILFFESSISVFTFLFIWLIDYYTSLRTRIRNFRDRLIDVVDSYNIDNRNNAKSQHSVYIEIIKEINVFFKKNFFEDIYCFTRKNTLKNKLYILKSSTFVWQYSFELNDLEKLEKRKYALNIGLVIDGVKKNTNIILKVNYENYDYFFILTSIKNLPIYYQIIGVERLFYIPFLKLSKMLLAEMKIKHVKNFELKKISERNQYVNRAIKAMHFIRNRLSSPKNLLKMLEIKNSVSPEKFEKFNVLFEKEKERTKLELNLIIERANYLLEKSNNPFVFIETTKVSVEKIYSILKSNVLAYFPLLEIDIRQNKEKLLGDTKVNIEGLEVFLNDWLHNMYKYHKNIIKVLFDTDDNYIYISFVNDFKENKSKIDSIIDELMSDNKKEIIKRTTHGIYQIKSCLDEMRIEYTVQRDENLLEFNLKLVKYVNYKNSSL